MKVRDGEVRNPNYVVMGATANGERIWAGDGAEGAKCWLQVLTELENRGVKEVLITERELKGWPKHRHDLEPALVQQCIVHLIRNRFRSASRQHRDAILTGLRPVRGCREGSRRRVRGRMGDRYAAILEIWENAWAEFVPFIEYDVEIRKVICTINAVESINAHYRRAVRARGHFPNQAVAMKCLYLVTRSLGPAGAAGHAGRSGRSPRSTSSALVARVAATLESRK